MIRVITKEDCTISDLNDITSLCAENRDLENFSDVNWGNNPKSLLYKFTYTDIFSEKNGAYFLLYQDEKLVHMSGVNKSEFDENVYICGVRTLTKKEYRHKLLMSQFMIPAQEAIVKVLGGKMMFFCFENGGSIYNVLQKGKFDLFLQKQTEKFNVYKDLTTHTKPVYINHTKHCVLYKPLDYSYKFDWEKIHYDNVHREGC
jgi:hypothetical protein